MIPDCGAVVIGPVPHLAGALAVINDLKFDLALLDVNLQGERVYPVARKLAAQGVPFALVSGYSRIDLPAEFWRRPILTKPFLPRELTELVAQVMGLELKENPVIGKLHGLTAGETHPKPAMKTASERRVIDIRLRAKC